MKPENAWYLSTTFRLVLVAGLLIALSIYVLRLHFQKAPHVKKSVPQLTMIQTQLPLPPPPEPIAQTPAAKIETLEAQIPEKPPESAPEPAEKPPLGELGLDAEGEAGADGFGLIANRGGQSLLAGNSGSAVLWYGGQIKERLEEDLQNLLADSAAMKSGYDVLISVWVDADGRVSRGELISSSGVIDVDRSIRQALLKLELDIGQAPPANMPQPVKIRLISKV
jgi:periplasmic protein TonB